MLGLMRSFSPIMAAALAAGLALLAPSAAHAQAGPNVAAHGFQPVTKQQQLPGYNTQPPPPALPGTLNQSAPAERTQLDLPPTESLFDAINRGDIATARDAINRGADLGGHNILGMTPLDLSVDLSRNDITFLLLSLRNGSAPAGVAPPAAAQAAAAAPATGSKPAPAKTAAATPAKPTAKIAAVAPRPAAIPVATVKTAAPAQPYVPPGSTGTPNPQAGFLGFGGTAQ